MSVSVSVLVPYRADGGARDDAWAYAHAWWTVEHPDWQVVVGGAPDGPWCKAAAVADALAQADGDVVVMADADVICPGVERAVHAVTAGAPWAMPHRGVYRLSQTATALVYAGLPLPDVGQPRAQLFQHCLEVHVGAPGGGLVVLPRATLEAVPLDPRFQGWGQEDLAWGHALAVMAGPAWRGAAPLWHLWHPPAQRRSRRVGTDDGLALWRRYRAAGNPAAMAELLAEIQTSNVDTRGCGT